MTTPTKNTKETAPDDMPGDSSATVKQPPCKILVKVLKPRLRYGNLICAQGAQIVVTAAEADQMVADGAVIKLGYQPSAT